MKILTLIALLVPFYASAKTIYQCAVDNVTQRGPRVNIIENNGSLRANLIFGTTVSGTMYKVSESDQGYTGKIRNRPEFTLDLVITQEKTENSNINGFRSHLKAVYPTFRTQTGFDIVDTDLVCGEKISDRWH